MSAIEAAALELAAAGFRVFPVHYPVEDQSKGYRCSCGQADCRTPAKHPLVRCGVDDATSNAEKIREWWHRWPLANLAVACGPPLVIDVDPRHGGQLSALGEIPDDAPRVATGGEGWHLWFGGTGRGGRIDANAIEVKGAGTYVIAPPSQHISGRFYTFVVGINGGLPELPERLRPRVRALPPPTEGEEVKEGQRHDRLVSYAGHLKNRGLGAEEIGAVLADFNRRNCKPPVTEEEVRRIALDSQGWEQRRTAAGGDAPPLTDLGNAERLVASYGQEINHAPGIGWLVWDGRRWAPDRTGGLQRLAKRTARAIYGEAAGCADDDERKRIVSWARASESESRLRALVALAATERPVVVLPERLDADPWALAVLNGTVDLRTGQLRSHERAELISKVAAARYDPDARSLEWEPSSARRPVATTSSPRACAGSPATHSPGKPARRCCCSHTGQPRAAKAHSWRA